MGPGHKGTYILIIGFFAYNTLIIDAELLGLDQNIYKYKVSSIPGVQRNFKNEGVQKISKNIGKLLFCIQNAYY